MKYKGHLFELYSDLQVYNKNIKIKKDKKTGRVSTSTSANFYHEQHPIQVIGPGGLQDNFANNMSLEWNIESFDVNETEDTGYSLVSSYTNGNNYESETGDEFDDIDDDDDETASADIQPAPGILSILADDLKQLTWTATRQPANSEEDNSDDIFDFSGTSGEPAKNIDSDDLAADMAAILQGKKLYDPGKRELIVKEKADEDFIKKMNEADKQRSDNKDGNNKADAGSDEKGKDQYAIFDRIAKSMNYANSFDLGEFEIEQRFDIFDRQEDEAKKVVPPGSPATGYTALVGADNGVNRKIANQPSETLPLSTQDFLKDLDLINVQTEALETIQPGKDWPPPLAGLMQPSHERTRKMFGTFEYDDLGRDDCEIKIKGHWDIHNIDEKVPIPQLAGKYNASTKKVMKEGIMKFNKKAIPQLQRLWEAWEAAGLLDRVLTYDGGFVPRFMKIKGGGCTKSLSNHAWGTAFDINAKWNARGDEPALVGKEGSTRELVEIANQHGFYWGGHFSKKDGMHFEVAEIIV